MNLALIKQLDFLRIGRFVLGVFILYEGYRSREFLLMLMGGTFMVMSLLNIGCFGSSNCARSSSNTSRTNEDEEVIFEEVK